MKFNVSSSKLFSQLQAVSRVINNKNALPILDDVLFDLSGNELTLTASDGETTIRTSIEVDNVEGAGKVASAAKLLLETLKEFSEQPLAFTIDENNFAVSMVSQNGTYSFVGVNGNEYPEMPAAEADARSIAMPANILQSAIEKTIFCTADDDLRPVMNGIFFDIAEDKVTMVATDAHRLVRYTNTGVQSGAAASFILPKKPAGLLKNLLAKEEEEVKVTFGAKNARFEFGSTIIVCRQRNRTAASGAQREPDQDLRTGHRLLHQRRGDHQLRLQRHSDGYRLQSTVPHRPARLHRKRRCTAQAR